MLNIIAIAFAEINNVSMPHITALLEKTHGRHISFVNQSAKELNAVISKYFFRGINQPFSYAATPEVWIYS